MELDAITILRAQLTQAHEMVEFAMTDLSQEHLHHMSEGSTIHSIATVYAHLVQSEDALMNTYVREQPMLFEREGWQDKVGVGYELQFSALADAIKSGDIDALRVYAQSVYFESAEYLATLSESDLDRPVTFGSMGDFPLGIFLGTFVVWQAVQHGGEICALKGCLGGQGLPF